MPDDYDFLVQYDPPKLRTNADRIRAMSDEELEVFLSNITTDALLYGAGMREKPETVIGHKISWIKWLKEEVKE